jgi:hypothetical protein
MLRPGGPSRLPGNHHRAGAAILDKQTFYLDVEHAYRCLECIDMVPNLSPRNLVSVEIGRDFMLSQKYIKNGFDVRKWAAPKFLELAAKEMLKAKAKCKKRSTAKLPEGSKMKVSTTRLG